MGSIILSILALLATFIFGPASNASASINYGEEVSEEAKRYVGDPYKWGGTTPKGFDASGLRNMYIKQQQLK